MATVRVVCWGIGITDLRVCVVDVALLQNDLPVANDKMIGIAAGAITCIPHMFDNLRLGSSRGIK